MNELEQARREIDEADAQLAALFERRMRAVVQVALYKKAHGLPIHDPAREEQVLQKAAGRIADPALRPYYLDHVRNRMALARQYEALLLGQNRVAYQGVEGAFAHIALRQLFPHAEAVSCPTWDEVFAKVSAGDAAYGVVPFENSHAGDVSAVLDLCYNHPELWVVKVYDLPVRQNLLALPGAQLGALSHVYSHQQAISQSETFLKRLRLPATAMANALGMGEVQVRKDLALVSDGGRPKIGYLREGLIEDISQFLGYDNTTDAILVGAGKLGQALLGYSGFEAYGLNILAAFDISPKAEKTVDGKPIIPMERMESFCRTNKVLMGIITVPSEHAQEVCDRMIACGIKAIWNFAPVHLDVPGNILVQNENMATSLAVLSMHLQAQIKEKK